MLSPARVEIKGSRIGNIPSRGIRYDGDIIAYLVLLRPAFERRESGAHGDIRRPCDAAIRAERIEQLRIHVIRSVSRVQPHRINPPIGSYRQRTKPVPLVMINWIVVDSVRRAKSEAAVGAAHEHYIGAGGEARRLYTGNHVNIVVSRPAGAVHCQKQLPQKSTWIRSAGVSEVQIAAETDLSNLVKSWRDCRVLRIAGAKAPKRARKVGRAADKEIAVCIYIKRSPDRRARKKDWTHPCGPIVGRAAKLPAAKIVARSAPSLILEPVTRTVSFVYGEPLLVAPADVTKC